MSFILKKPTEDSKGIIVFTHKELPYLRTCYYVPGIFFQLKKQYVLAMHWGWYRPNTSDIPFIDFHLAGRGTLNFKNEKKHIRYNFCSRNFIPKIFEKKEIEKKWDILMIVNPSRAKNTHEFLLVIRKIYDKNIYPKVLLICSNWNKGLDKKKYYIELMDDYDRLFSFEEKKIFTIDVPNSKNIYGLKQDAMPEIYNQARVFSLFSDVEGQSRVIAEALVCGIPVVVKKHLMGGGRDYLNDKNSKLFSSIDESVDAFLHVLNNYHQYEFDALTYQKELREDYTIPKLKKTIQQYYKNNNLVFKGCLNVENLTRQLPSHVVSLPMRLLKKESRTNDLKSPLAVVGFIKFLLKKDFSSYYVFYSFVATVWVIHKIAIFVKVIIKKFILFLLPAFFKMWLKKKLK